MSFWQLHGAGTTYINYEPPRSFVELVRSSDFMVVGRITAVSVHHPLPENPWASVTDLPITLVTVTDADGKTYAFPLVRIVSPDCVLSQALPQGQFMFALNSTRAEPPATVECAAVDCILSVIPSGGVDSVLVDDPSRPSNSWSDTRNVRSIDDLVAAAEKAEN